MFKSDNKGMIVVAGHAIYSRKVNAYDLTVDKKTGDYIKRKRKSKKTLHWHGLEPDKFTNKKAQKQMIKAVEQHVDFAFELLENKSSPYNKIVFSGGRTRGKLHKIVKNSEAEGMIEFAKKRDKFSKLIPDCIAETCAIDSFTNILYSLMAYYEDCGYWPENVAVISMPHKSIRFYLMARGLKINLSKFTFYGIGGVPDVEVNCWREIGNIMKLIDHGTEGSILNPLLRGKSFSEKRAKRESKCENSLSMYPKASEVLLENLALLNTINPSEKAWKDINWPWE